MKFYLIMGLVFFFILPASALIPAANVSDNKSYIAENNTNTSFIPENSETFIPEDTLTSIPTVINQVTSSGGGSSSGGGGGGGGGTSSAENFSNILQFEEHEGTLIAGQPASFKFNLSIYEVILTGKENEDVSTRVELLKDLPQKATIKPQGEAISYFNVVISSKRLKEAVIRFNSTQPTQLFGWNGSSWMDMIGYTENSCENCYTYSIVGYSSFAIVNGTPMIQVVSPSQPLMDNWSISTLTPTITDPPKQSSGFGVGLVLIALFFAFRKR